LTAWSLRVSHGRINIKCGFSHSLGTKPTLAN
jgi:hypothetical protein